MKKSMTVHEGLIELLGKTLADQVALLHPAAKKAKATTEKEAWKAIEKRLSK